MPGPHIKNKGKYQCRNITKCSYLSADDIASKSTHGNIVIGLCFMRSSLRCFVVCVKTIMIAKLVDAILVAIPLQNLKHLPNLFIMRIYTLIVYAEIILTIFRNDRFYEKKISKTHDVQKGFYRPSWLPQGEGVSYYSIRSTFISPLSLLIIHMQSYQNFCHTVLLPVIYQLVSARKT